MFWKKKYINFKLLLLGGLVSCGSIWGENSLGNKLFLLEGDRKEDRVIVYCSGKGEEGCKAAIYMVPTYERHYINGKYAEYVELVKANKYWVIAKSVQLLDKEENYWIISKKFDSEGLNCEESSCEKKLQSYVIGPLDLAKFKNKKKELNITIDF